MDVCDTPLGQRHVTVFISEVCIHRRDHAREPLPVLKRDELIVPAVPELYRDLDRGELETPSTHVCHAVIPPALVTRGKPELAAGEEVLRVLRCEGSSVDR